MNPFLILANMDPIYLAIYILVVVVTPIYVTAFKMFKVVVEAIRDIKLKQIDIELKKIESDQAITNMFLQNERARSDNDKEIELARISHEAVKGELGGDEAEKNNDKKLESNMKVRKTEEMFF